MRGFLKSKITGSGIALLAVGIFAAVIGLGAFVNYSQVCFVNPGGYPCSDRYQVALLAPLYPLSGVLLMTGILIVALGFTFMALGLRQPREGLDVSGGKPTN